jgi:lipoate-protein ligase A
MQHLAEEVGLSPEDHLAREWTLFRSAELSSSGELLRYWEATRPVVVVGRSGRLADDVLGDACVADGVPILRRFTGGGTVVLAPGCLNYAVVLSLVSRPELTDVAGSFRSILGRLARALGLPNLSFEGDADLALEGRKVSGNAQRRGRMTLFHHGTLLYAFDSRLADRYLKAPVRAPAYRAGRRHEEFLTNLPLSAAGVRQRLAQAWPV